MLDFSLCSIKHLSVHQTGNKQNGEPLLLSKQSVAALDEDLEAHLLSYFLKPFQTQEYYHLSFSNDDHALNPVFNYAKDLFERPDSFHIQSIHLAKHLYEIAIHPNILAGDFYVCSFDGMQYQGNLVQAIGIFKAETKDHFLKVSRIGQDYDLAVESGIAIDKLDKGCLIINVEEEKGFRVCVTDKTNKSSEAAYWKDLYLKIKPCSDAYHLTQNFLHVTKDFLTKQVPKEFEVSRTDQIDLLNRSVAFFKENETFNEHLFTEQVFEGNEGLVTSFKDYKNSVQTEYEIELKDGFDISEQAVKKQAKVFKSILKLDKNFHIYIHGNKNMIEKGIESDGRKFYKIYYNEEH